MKRKLRYRVVVKGTTISRHMTKANAVKASSSIRGARVVKIGTTKRKTYSKKRYY